MFTRTTTIATALKARPELRDILPAFHPAFARLRHPVLGKVLPRLVTVEDAARIAGVDPDVLLEVMNLPGAPRELHPAAPAAAAVEPAPAWLVGASPRELDVRPVLARGDEPFAEIMAALRELPRGEVMVLLAPFEPAPLLRLLGRQGWLHYVAWDDGAERTCRVALMFPAEAGARAGPPAGDAPTLADHLRPDGDGWVLDVRELAPPDPMRLALEAVDGGHLPLRMRHRREPTLLLPKLHERGLRVEVSSDGGEVTVRIARP